MPFVSPQLELLMEINSLLAFCPYPRVRLQIPRDSCLGMAAHHPSGGALCHGCEVPRSDNEVIPSLAAPLALQPCLGFPGGI